jgi:ubiquinone/menaquinone biosynthesis C-methylase UbiE
MVDYNQLAQDYAQYRQVHPEVLRTLLSGSNLDSRSCVLEVGCGTGNYIRQIQASTHCTCYGLDPSTEMLRQAAARSTHITFTQARAEALSVPDHFFDLVYSVDVIHHVADRRAYFNEAWRALKPGGKVCTATDSEWIIRNRVPLSSYFPATIEPELRRYPTIEQLRAEMSASGFQTLVENKVEFHYALTDASPIRNKVYSVLHLIAQEEFARGLAQMERDLQAGPIQCVSRYVLVWGIKPA